MATQSDALPADSADVSIRVDCGPDRAPCITTDRSTTLLLVGKTGTGRSTLGNALLGWPAFPTGRGLCSVTTQCHRAVSREGDHAAVEGRLAAVDTPGLGAQEGRGSIEAEKEIERGIQMAAAGAATDGGLDAVLVTLDISARLTKGDFEALNALRELLGHRCFRERVILVWTHADVLRAEGVQPGELLDGVQSEALRALLVEVQGRCAVVDAALPGAGDVASVMAAVRAVVAARRGSGYTAADVPKRMRLKQARRLRQLAAREETACGETQGSWFGWLVQLVVPQRT